MLLDILYEPAFFSSVTSKFIVRRGRKEKRKKERKRMIDLVCSPGSRGRANRNCTYAKTYLSTEFIIARKLKRVLARSLARVAQRMLVINTFRPLSHARFPLFRASNFRSFRRGHTLVGETLTSDLCLRRARRERKKSGRESAAKMTDLVAEPRLRATREARPTVNLYIALHKSTEYARAWNFLVNITHVLTRRNF